jgi:hypothetical protein
MTDQRLTYLHENPVRAGIVDFASHYKYSSAVDYYEERGGLLRVGLCRWQTGRSPGFHGKDLSHPAEDLNQRRIQKRF